MARRRTNAAVCELPTVKARIPVADLKRKAIENYEVRKLDYEEALAEYEPVAAAWRETVRAVIEDFIQTCNDSQLDAIFDELPYSMRVALKLERPEAPTEPHYPERTLAQLELTSSTYLTLDPAQLDNYLSC